MESYSESLPLVRGAWRALHEKKPLEGGFF